MTVYINNSVQILGDISTYLIQEPYIYFVVFFLAISIVTILKRSLM